MVLGENQVQKTSFGLLLGMCFTMCHVYVAVPVLQGGKGGSHLPLLPLQLCRGPGGTKTSLALPCFRTAKQWLCWQRGGQPGCRISRQSRAGAGRLGCVSRRAGREGQLFSSAQPQPALQAQVSRLMHSMMHQPKQQKVLLLPTYPVGLQAMPALRPEESLQRNNSFRTRIAPGSLSSC